MNVFDLFQDSLKFSIGWTLFHTLWQGALIYSLIKILHWIVPKQKSPLKYIINCSAMVILLLSCVSTFLYLNASSAISFYEIKLSQSIPSLLNASSSSESNSSALSTLIHIINSQMTWVLSAWVVGVLFFSIRFFGGLFYIHLLKTNVIEVSLKWTNRLEELSERIGLKRIIRLAESVHINKPMVVGYIKPMILLPIGLLSGLPQQMVEAILLHELAHIKRHDFLINIVQSIIEVLLFFNPFVWILSEMIRKEREHCCDDQVIISGPNPIVYVKALAKLEEVRQNPTPALALALNKNKHQVFNRIKRIMETSVNRHPGKIKPFALLVLITAGLFCASWLTINPQKELIEKPTLKKEVAGIIATQADTIIKKNKNREKDKGRDKNKDMVKNKVKDKDKKKANASYSRQTTTTYDKDGTPHEEVIENFEGDEEYKSLFSNPGSYSFTMPAIPTFPSMPAIPAIPPIPYIPFDMGFSYSFDGDTLPRNRHFPHEDEEEWESFGRIMEERFEEFGANNEEFGHMMEEWAEKFKDNFAFHFDENLNGHMEDLHDQLQDLHHSESLMDNFDYDFKGLEEQLERFEEKLKEHKGELRHLEDNMREYEKELSDQLIKDGYLKKGDEVNSMNWGDGKLSINGIKIKEKDIPKYEALTKKYFKGNEGFYHRD